MLLNADIVVVGGGMAGFAAAMAAAQQGKKVVLLEKLNQLGGNAINSNAGTICGAYYRTLNTIPQLVGYKFCKNFISELLLNKSKLINYHNGLHVVSYDWRVLASTIEQQLVKANVQIVKNAIIESIVKQNDIISQVKLQQNDHPIILNTQSVIDCSGNGFVSQLTGLEMITSPSYQSASQVFTIANVTSDSEFSLNMALRKTMLKLVSEKHWPDSFTNLSVIPGSLKAGDVDLKITLPDLVTDDLEIKNQLSVKGKAYVNEIFPSLTKEIEGLKNASIKLIFPEVGIRIQQRSLGKQVLNEEDVMLCHKPTDGIALGAWPIEEWEVSGKLNMQYFEENNGYLISADCIQSKQIRNLFFAGKNISATNKAIASARVIGTCLQTGYAAGKLATCKTDNEKASMIQSLHNELVLNND